MGAIAHAAKAPYHGGRSRARGKVYLSQVAHYPEVAHLSTIDIQAWSHCLAQGYSVGVVRAGHRISVRVERLTLLAGPGLGCQRWMRRSLSCRKSEVASATGPGGRDSQRGGIATWQWLSLRDSHRAADVNVRGLQDATKVTTSG